MATDAATFLKGMTDEERVRWFFDHFHTQNQDPEDQEYTAPLTKELRITSVSAAMPHPSVTYSYTVKASHCNRNGSLHGGAAATLFDYCTSIVLAAVSKPVIWLRLGVSRTLSVTYLRPPVEGTEVIIECELVQIGRRMATIRGTMKRRSDGAILAICEHGKFNTDGPTAKA